MATTAWGIFPNMQTILISAAGFGYVLNYLTLDGQCLRTKMLVDRVDIKVFNKDGLMLVQSL